jgi:hypothetical protein
MTRPLLVLEKEARDARRGLWALPASERVPPWRWHRERHWGFLCGTQSQGRAMSYAPLSCQGIIDACLEGLEAAHSALALPHGGDTAALEEMRRDVRVMQGLLALALATHREGNSTMQISAGDFLLLADFYGG